MHYNLPFISIPILEHKHSASYIEWVVSVIAAFLNFKLYISVFHKNLFAIGSNPLDGSSKNSISGPPIKAIETHNFLLFPPLKFYDFTNL